MPPRQVDSEDLYYAALQEMAREHPEYLECRGGQHRMNLVEPFRIVDTDNETGMYPHEGHRVYARRVLECDRCGKRRNDFYAITSHRGHTLLRRINATYEDPPGYAIPGLGRVPNARGLVMGMALDENMSGTQVRGRGRPRRGEAS